MDRLNPGMQIMDRYELVQKIGTGLGGETWEARGPEGPVAIKVVREGEVGPDAFDDLIREAGLLRGLSHPNVVSYREFADRPDLGCAFLVTELVDGGDLGRHLRRHGPYSAEDAARLGLQLVEALSVLHHRGVLHRDLKPANVLVCSTDEGLPTLRVADFGISRRFRAGVVETLDVKLTPGFAAPEQFRRGTLTPATDVFALGGILFTIATGGIPQQDLSRVEDLDLAPHQRAPASQETRDLSEIDADLETDAGLARLSQVILAMVHHDPLLRVDLGAARIALEAVMQGEAPPIGGRNKHAKSALPTPITVDSMLSEEPPPSTTTPSSKPSPWRAALGVFFLGALAIWAALRPMDTDITTPGPRVTAKPPRPPPLEVAPTKAKAKAKERDEHKDHDKDDTPDVPAKLRVSTQPWSTVKVDGKRLGRTKVGGATFELPPGRHKVVLEAEDGTRYSKTVHLKAGATKSLCVKLRMGLETACR